ncbi:nitroreductase/quinone reductase family protein [Streptomonospora nanhaiensis]|uniref:Deazaflavin-dependent oxidoreductase (Nitroreductase family) n=1 Tax=Streptomonospora nanhaiensis TaxID=1323731 RepID=A0A853BNF5_9ACTN|nr:nitroreductase/quinone reductase family protein [Streptomonospora nanhaiensis]MBX9389972.1 nitroreductase/quinone reductase family protein [Streptomonospora nanhaiensis]NYI95982.1 deazaflavin-dependent oxidoreductase (nitroreductase family) [Streptomonospora nanhaiensis]
MTEADEPGPAAFNRQVIAEFRANGGVVGGVFAGAPLVLLTTAGARTGRPHTNPAVYARDGERLLVFASNAGGPRNPAWYHNLLAHPQVTVEIADGRGGVAVHAARAEPLDGRERDRQYALQAERDPAFAAYQAGTARTIPVVALHPLDLTGDPERGRAIAAQLTRHHDDLRARLARARAAVDWRLAGEDAAGDAGGRADGLDGGADLLGNCLSFCDALGLHHIREDGAFTAFKAAYPALRPAVARLRAEHRAVAALLADLRELSEGAAETADWAALRTDLDRIGAELERHFAYEEQALLPPLEAAGR